MAEPPLDPPEYWWREIECQECGQTFILDTVERDADGDFVCPHCGAPDGKEVLD